MQAKKNTKKVPTKKMELKREKGINKRNQINKMNK